ncbi:MAG: hypothetical protein JSV09_05840, partial [Thermoplasmata archaeon]
ILSMYRRERKYITLTKLGLVLFLWFVFLCWNPLYWPQQIYRRLNKGSLITPDAPEIISLNTTFTNSAFYNGPYNRSTLQGQFQELSDIQYFIYNPGFNDDDWINYTYDYFQYPGVFEHVPLPSEVLENRQDDCDGIAVVTVSLLVLRGYEAYVAESDSHWWTYVRICGEDLNSSIRGKTYTTVYLNWWTSIGEPYMIFNQTRVIITQPLLVSWWEQMTDGYYVEIIQEFGWPLLESPAIIAALPFALFVIGFLFSFGVTFPRPHSEPLKWTKKLKRYIPNALLAAIVIGSLLLLLLFIPESLMPYSTFILMGGLGALAYVSERDYLTKWIWKPEK